MTDITGIFSAKEAGDYQGLNGYETVFVESGDRRNSQHFWKIPDKSSSLLETIQIKVSGRHFEEK